MKKLIFLLVAFYSSFGQIYTECQVGMIIMTRESSAFLEISSLPPGLVCEANFVPTIQAGWSYQTWCVTISGTTGIFWNTVYEEYLGYAIVSGVPVLTISSIFNPSIHEWTITAIPYVTFGTISQKTTLGSYALSQMNNYNGGGAVTQTESAPVGLKLLNPSDITQLWYLGGLARDAASSQPLSTCTVDIQSVDYPNTFLRSDGSIVNLQFAADGYEVWIIEYTGESNINGNQIFCLQNNQFLTYLTLDTNPDCSSPGCMTATCGPQQLMVFQTNANGNLIIQSNYNEAYFLNINGAGLTQSVDSGAGVVSWQTTPSEVTINPPLDTYPEP